jgi:hypothetical protein
MGIGRADARRAWLRKRSCRAGSIEQHLMLQYFAVGLCTGSLHPTRAQMRGMAARCECFDMPTSDVTAGVYAAAITPCQPFCSALSASESDAFDTRKPVHNVDNRALRLCSKAHACAQLLTDVWRARRAPDDARSSEWT